ncbi:hypothetical protein BN2476_630035 [Paraburkholderia piptadeniae]|uniref:Uncharacterized protein n=1 Tax=Paraburkholderia piptadeniae TaxID=1701573 RepID=A0A1N7SL97_9BURK|nr:hypothetical protein BN2476_630035 [Paraburkholderia piptadeniae]
MEQGQYWESDSDLTIISGFMPWQTAERIPEQSLLEFGSILIKIRYRTNG